MNLLADLDILIYVLVLGGLFMVVSYFWCGPRSSGHRSSEFKLVVLATFSHIFGCFKMAEMATEESTLVLPVAITWIICISSIQAIYLIGRAYDKRHLYRNKIDTNPGGTVRT